MYYGFLGNLQTQLDRAGISCATQMISQPITTEITYFDKKDLTKAINARNLKKEDFVKEYFTDTQIMLMILPPEEESINKVLEEKKPKIEEKKKEEDKMVKSFKVSYHNLDNFPLNLEKVKSIFQDFANKIKREIVISCEHIAGMPGMTKEEDKGVRKYIHLGSSNSPAATTKYFEVAEIFKIPLSSSQGRFLKNTNGLTTLSAYPETNIIFAETSNEDIWVFFDPMMSKNRLEELTRNLVNELAFFILEPTKYQERSLEVTPEALNLNRKDFAEIIKRGGGDRIKKMEAEIKSYQEQIKNWERSSTDYYGRIRANNMNIRALQAAMEGDTTRLGNDFDALMKMKRIAKVECNNSSNQVIVYTKPIITKPVKQLDNLPRDLGMFKIIYTVTGESGCDVKVLNMTRNIGGVHHPHGTDMQGGTCWGNQSGNVTQMLGNRDFVGMTQVILQILENPYYDDSAGRRVADWPKVEAQEAVSK